MQRLRSRIYTFPALLGLIVVLASSSAVAQYKARFLASNFPGKTKNTEPLLMNPWGLVYAPGGPFWVSDNASGWSTLYGPTGVQQSLEVIVPTANGTGFGTPTGIVFNGSQEFAIDSWVSVFLFATLDGSIQGWSPFNLSATLVGATSAGSSYTGLAITNYASGNSLFAADAANNRVDIYDGNFNLTGSFTDSTIPAGFAPFGIQDISGQVYVTYGASNGGSGGYVDIFTEAGTFVKRFTSNGALNQPWGLAVAPGNFGKFSGALLVTNNSNAGNILAYNLTNGSFLGRLSDTSGDAIKINGLWGIEFGGGSSANGAKNQLFFTAGPNDLDGFFGVIDKD